MHSHTFGPADSTAQPGTGRFGAGGSRTLHGRLAVLPSRAARGPMSGMNDTNATTSLNATKPWLPPRWVIRAAWAIHRIGDERS